MATRKTTPKQPAWLHNLQNLLAERGMNPRQLSLLAGLNPTAVRDMLSGRARYPRYDTLLAITKVLETTPAYLMGDAATRNDLQRGGLMENERIELLTEIIARLQDTAEDMNRKLSAKELASMATTLYQQILTDETASTSLQALDKHARTLVSYASMQTENPVIARVRRA
jgi:transcriptional regulator with XRE-family HTH domain